MPTDHLAALEELANELEASAKWKRGISDEMIAGGIENYEPDAPVDVADGLAHDADVADKQAERIRAAIALMRGQSEVPFGMALVPLEATPEMLANYEYVRSGADWQRHVAPLTKRQLGRHRKAYAAMLKVVGYPQPIPAQERDDA